MAQLRFVLVSCDCRKGERYIDGTRPIFTVNADQALRALMSCLDREDMFFGVHLQGKHVLNAYINGQSVRAVD